MLGRSQRVPPLSLLFICRAVINDVEGHEVVTLGGNAISKNMFKVV